VITISLHILVITALRNKEVLLLSSQVWTLMALECQVEMSSVIIS
jgi:hypothetical protein